MYLKKTYVKQSHVILMSIIISDNAQFFTHLTNLFVKRTVYSKISVLTSINI